MKVTTDDLIFIREKIVELYKVRKRTLKQDKTYYAENQLSRTRLYHDLLVASTTTEERGDLYKKYNDRHLETAIKKIVREWK